MSPDRVQPSDRKDALVQCAHGLLGELIPELPKLGAAAAAGTVAIASGAGVPLLIAGLAAYLASGLFTARANRAQHEKLIGLIEHAARTPTAAADEAAIESALRDADLQANIRDVGNRVEVLREILTAQGQGIDALRASLAKHEGLWISLERFLLDNFDLLKTDLRTTLDTRFAAVECLIREALAQRPTLEPPTPLTDYDRDSAARYLFSARRVELLGREAELRELDTFLDDPRPFRWALWTGEGGQGKTRLAFEVMLARESCRWRTGRLPRPVPNHPGFTAWDTWQPGEPTLIVVDYAAAFREQLPPILAALARRAATPGALPHPVRLLLLERPGQDDFARTLADSPSNKDNHNIRAACANRFEPDPTRGGDRLVPRELKPLDENTACAIIEAVWHERRPNESPPARDQILAAFKDADEFLKRPLFAAFAGDALASGSPATRWSKEDLANHVLKTERRRWEQFVIQDNAERIRYERLLALATMTRGFSLEGGTHDRPGFFDHASVRDLQNHLPKPEDFTDRNAPGPRRYAGLIGFARPDAFIALRGLKSLPGLEPDLLGELFLMQVLADCNTQLATALGRAAWLVSPFDAAMTALLLTRDFVHDRRAAALLDLPRTDDPFPTRLFAAMSVVDRVMLLAVGGSIEQARKLYDGLAELGPEDTVRAARANAAFNLITALGNAGRVDDARAIYDDMAGFGSEEAVRVERARAVVNLIPILGNAGRVDNARAAYDDMADLGNEDAVRVERAKGAVNLVTILGNAERFNDAHALYGGMADLGNEEAVRVARAIAAYNLITALGEAGRVDDAHAVYGTMADLGNEDAVRVERAKAAFNLVTILGNARRFNNARAVYDSMADLGNEDAVRMERAQAAFNLITALGKAGRVDDARAVYDTMADLGNEDAVRVDRTKAVISLIVASWISGTPTDRSDATDRYAALARTPSVGPQEAEIRADAARRLLSEYNTIFHDIDPTATAALTRTALAEIFCFGTPAERETARAMMLANPQIPPAEIPPTRRTRPRT